MTIGPECVIFPQAVQVTPSPEQISKLLLEAGAIGLLGRANPSADITAALLGLSHILESRGKTVRPIFEGQVPPECRQLPGAEKIQSDFGPRNLIISMDIARSPIEKVSYSSDERVFSLVVTPLKRDFDIKNVRYDFEGGEFHLLVTLGAPELGALGKVYKEHQQNFERTPILNISNHNHTDEFGQINLIDASSKTVCELLFKNLPRWNLTPTPEAARCLLTGLSLPA